ncbi:MAG: type II toxin-antitoxin system HicB family antitoxin [Aphanizomenon gracile PMC638.10]|nr:type II toxin-antitoxin system HicB family antitoxin [Aphanizomenon gracile PMC638.10]
MSYKVSIVIEKDEHGYYAYCPELPGCQSEGDSLEIVQVNIKEAIVEKSLQQQLIKELINKLQRLNDNERSIYWNKVEYLNKNLEYNNFLWETAPLERKITIIRERFKKILEIISRFQDSEYPYAADISDSRHELYKLNELENMLIIKWDSSVIDNESKKEFKTEKMISARGAEKLVMQFYQKLGYQVEDISIHQVTQESQEWIKGDIRLNSTELLDCKE